MVIRRYRVSMVLCLALCIAPLNAGAGEEKKVEVVNLPEVQDVNVTNAPAVQDVTVTNDATNPMEVVGEVSVTNLPAASATARFQLVGFTATAYTGDMGGHFGVTQKCQLEFPDSRMCSIEEVAATTAIPGGLSGDAWIHTRGDSRNVLFDARLGSGSASCFTWRSGAALDGGRAVGSDGVDTDTNHPCAESRPIACCALR